MNNGCVKTNNGICVQCLDGLRLSANGCVTPTAYTCQSCGVGFVLVNVLSLAVKSMTQITFARSVSNLFNYHQKECAKS